MAIQFVGQRSSTNAACWYSMATSPLTGGIDTEPREGDLIIGSYVTCAPAAFTGWSLNQSQTRVDKVAVYGGKDITFDVIYKLQGATVDSIWDYCGTITGINGQQIVMTVWRGVSQLNPIDVTTPTTATGTGNTHVNPPAITPVTPGSLILAIGANSSDAAKTLCSNMTDVYQLKHGGTYDARNSMSKYENWQSGSFDPAAYTGGTNNANDSWAGITMALRPATRSVLKYEVALDTATDDSYEVAMDTATHDTCEVALDVEYT